MDGDGPAAMVSSPLLLSSSAQSLLLLVRTQRQDQQDIGPALIAFVTCLATLSLVFIGLRFYIRLCVIRKFGWDDWALFGTGLMTVSCIGGLIVVVKFGLGRHMVALSPNTQHIFLILIWFVSVGYHFNIMVLKTAFILQFRRAFPLPAFQRFCDYCLGFVACWAVAGMIAAITVCLPIPVQWYPESLEPQNLCHARVKLWIGYGVIHVVTDFVIFFMPLPMIRSLPLSKTHKIVLLGVFGLGFLTCAVSIVRLTTLHSALTSEDASWAMSKTVFWSVGEVACAILCLCIPTLRPLLILRCFRPRRPGSPRSDTLELQTRPASNSVATSSTPKPMTNQTYNTDSERQAHTIETQ